MNPPTQTGSAADFQTALRQYLEAVARQPPGTASYREALTALNIPPPRSMQKLTQALEESMTEDAAAGRALRAAVIVSGHGPALPRPGFFAHARSLGRYDGPEEGDAAADFHARELAALCAELGIT
ncbi:hypothetical protein [Algiphilus aromaticivorans]|uniref:hypothetical protein n=1 Tax=Algiphilus aromaticivorans TaxID=382454 RepID=UPI0006941A59|nr:hypothetical protein [Algiphilus aromaticivorans]